MWYRPTSNRYGNSTTTSFMGITAAVTACLILALSLPLNVASLPSRIHLGDKGHEFKRKDTVALWASQIGPFANPSETYDYYQLPFCQPRNGIKYKPLFMGFRDDRMPNTPYDLTFRANHQDAVVCEKKLSKEDLVKFRKAVADDWYFLMYYDDLPVWGFIGRMEEIFRGGQKELRYFVYTHFDFDIKFHGDRIIEINVATDQSRQVDITLDSKDGGGLPVKFSYSVRWTPTTTPFEDRLRRYKNFPFQSGDLAIHWFSIINSSITVLLLTAFLIYLLRANFVKHSTDKVGTEDEESEWTQHHGDVCRFPPAKNLFCALVGTGTQLFWLALFFFLHAFWGSFHPYNRGELFTVLVKQYALTACIAGYVSVCYFKQMEGEQWVGNMMLTCFVFYGPCFCVLCFLNTVAILYRSTAALSASTMWLLLGPVIPVTTILGSYDGKDSEAGFWASCATNKYPRKVPQLPWYRRPSGTGIQMLMAGILPFISIYIELQFILASAWGHKVYTTWSILFIVFILLLALTALTAVTFTHFQLAIDEHRWWWRSFFNGGSTAIYLYAYCIYYYFAISKMSGFMQTAYFFGYMAIVCFGFFLMLGAVGWRASLMYVRRIYKAPESPRSPFPIMMLQFMLIMWIME